MAGLIEGAYTNEVGHWVVPEHDPRRTAAYCRVSSHDQKADLDRQVARIAEWAALNHVTISEYVTEIGSGLSEKRRRLNVLLADSGVETIVVEHRDRLARFGVDHLMSALQAQGRNVMVLNADEVEDDLVRDMVDLMTCFSARLYRRRSARNRAKRAAEALRA